MPQEKEEKSFSKKISCVNFYNEMSLFFYKTKVP